MRRFFVAELGGEELALDREASHHLLDVVRIARGERLVAFDGRGGEREASLLDVREGVAILKAEGPVKTARPAFPLHLLLGLPKGPAADEAIRMATEAGATHVHPVLAARSVAQGDRGERWRRVALSAAQQCGRADTPEVLPLARLDEALGRVAGIELRLALPGAPSLSPAGGAAAVLVGPEGGFAPFEVDRALAAGARPMGLGAWVLRTDTAAAVACAMTAARP